MNKIHIFIYICIYVYKGYQSMNQVNVCVIKLIYFIPAPSLSAAWFKRVFSMIFWCMRNEQRWSDIRQNWISKHPSHELNFIWDEQTEGTVMNKIHIFIYIFIYVYKGYQSMNQVNLCVIKFAYFIPAPSVSAAWFKRVFSKNFWCMRNEQLWSDICLNAINQ